MKKWIVTFMVLCIPWTTFGQANLIINGGFDSELSPWTINNYMGATSQNSIVDNELYLDIHYQGYEHWHIQMTQYNLFIESGKTYTITFKARAASTRPLNVRVGQSQYPWTDYSNWSDVTLTTELSEYSHTFTMESAADANARLEFNFGQSVEDVYLDEISVMAEVEISESPIDLTLNSLSDFVVFGNTRTDLRDRVGPYTGGSLIGSNEYIEVGVDVEVGNVDDARLQSGRDIFLRERATINGDIILPGYFQSQSDVIVTGGIKHNVMPPIIDIPTQIVTTGTQDVIVGSGETYELVPGSYNNFHAYANAIIEIGAGEFNFESFFLEPDVKIVFTENLPTSINIENNLRFGDRTVMSFSETKSPLNINWYTNQTNSVVLGTGSKFYGSFTAPNAPIQLFSNSEIVGVLHGEMVTIEPDSKICMPPTLNDIYHSEGAYGPVFNKLISHYHATVPTAVTSVNLNAIPSFPNTTVKIDGAVAPQMVNLGSSNKTVTISLNAPDREAYLEGCGTSTYFITFEPTNEYSIRVNDDAPCSGSACNGLSWQTAFKDFQDGLDVATSQGKELWVAEGVYKPSKQTNVDDYRSVTFKLGQGNEVYGGFSGLPTESSNYGRQGLIHKTILTGDIDGDDGETWPFSWIKALDNSYHVVTFSGNSSHSIYMDRVSIQNGYANGLHVHDKIGAGILNVGSSGYIKEVIVQDNTSENQGGGLFNAFGDALDVENSVFYRNHSVYGVGGGMYSIMSSGTIKNSVFAHNVAQKGSAITNQISTIDLYNTSIAYNQAYAGGALYNKNFSSPKIQNSIIWGNINGSGKLILNEGGSAPEFSYSNIEGSFPSGVWYGDFGIDAGNNIASVPLFKSFPAPGEDGHFFSMDDGLQLSEGSPSIDAGKELVSVGIGEDIFSVLRPNDGDLSGSAEFDMGAYEFRPQVPEGNVRLGIADKTDNFTLMDRIAVMSIKKDDHRTIRSMVPTSAAYTIQLLVDHNKHIGNSFYGNVTAQKGGTNISTTHKVMFYKWDIEENGKWVFATQEFKNAVRQNGKPILFIDDLGEEETNNEDAYLIFGKAGGTLKLNVVVPHSQF
ncbi:MAG: carbohydrate binding domain-containing protein [Reichenbachiella sp.]